MTDKNTENRLRFFCSVTASVSHEIKNHIAVINEYAGLLEDLVSMTNRGKELDPDHLFDLAGKIKKQVMAADEIIGRLNRFSHTIDNFYYNVDINEVLTLSANLFKRMLLIKDIRLTLLLFEGQVRTNTSPFLLMNLILLCVEMFAELMEQGTAILLKSEMSVTGVSVSIKSEGVFKKEVNKSFFLKGVAADLVSELEADISFYSDKNLLVIMLPGSCRQ